MTSYTTFVGIDISAASLSAAWGSTRQTIGRAQAFAQTPAGWRALLDALHALQQPHDTILVVVEATGSDWMNVVERLQQAGFAVSLINPRQAHHLAQATLQRAKTDALDAQLLARLAALLQPPLWTPPPSLYPRLRDLLTQRDQILRLRQQLANQLHALRQHPQPTPDVIDRYQRCLATFAAELKQLDAQIEATLDADPAWHANASRLRTIPGIGLQTAAWLLVATHNFALPTSAPTLVAFAGLAPHPRQSGSALKSDFGVGGGHARLRTALYISVAPTVLVGAEAAVMPACVPPFTWLPFRRFASILPCALFIAACSSAVNSRKSPSVPSPASSCISLLL